MKRNLLFIIFCSLFSAVNAQNISLKWDGTKKIDYGTESKTLPHFSNDGFNFEEGNVIIRVNLKSADLLKAENLQWEKISEKDLFDISKYEVKSGNHIDVSSYLNNGENYTSVRIEAFKTEKNQIFRLAGFSLVKDTKPQTQNFTQRAGTTNNPLKQGNFYKIKVDKSGIFKITTQFLRSNGINPADINPKNFRIYGNGGLILPEYNRDNYYKSLQEDAIEVSGENDGVWNDGDYALFYAQGPDGFNLFKGTVGDATNRRTETRSDRSLNVKNIYENASYYFINFDTGPGKRVQSSDTPLSADLISTYDDYQVLNEEKVNLLKIGRVFLGDFFNNNKSVTFTTRVPLKADDIITYKTEVAPYQFQGNSIKININNQNENNYSFAPGGQDYIFADFLGNISGVTGNQITFNYSPTISSNPNGVVYLNYAEVSYKQDLLFNGSQMNFRSYDIEENSNTDYGFSLSGASSAEAIWDVSDVTNAKKKVNKASGDNYNFGYTADNSGFNNEFVAFKNSAAFTPAFVGKIAPQDLSGLSNIDYLIVTSPEMVGQAQRLADYHKNINNYNAVVVDATKIYNEFSSGSKDITAIRDFVTRLNSTNGSLKYLMILGDTSFDYKGILFPDSDIIPSYQSEYSQSFTSSFVTDYYFTMTSPQTSSNIQGMLSDLPVGRLPAANAAEAKLLIDKTLAYYNQLPNQSTPFGDWRMKLDFVVDDDLQNESPPSGIAFHTAADNAIKFNFEGTASDKPEYNVRKLYLDSYPATNSAGGQRYPQVNQAISSDVSNSLFLFYFGHGGINGWSQERVLTSTEVKNFNNYNTVYSRFPLVSTITCEFTLWDDPSANSTGEQVIKSKTGGAATMITSSRAVGVDYGINFTRTFVDQVFKLDNDDFRSLGTAFLEAERVTGPNSNHLKVNFLGDPAMKLSRPKKLVTIETIDSPVPGQLRALDFVTITGKVNKPDGSIDTFFSGRISINIYDKRLNKKTLNNDGFLLPILDYTEEGSPIVKTSGEVKNGLYTVKFYVPKDINYTVGTGRILAYADNKKFDVFVNQSYQIGDINPNGLNDTTPPVVHLFMNNTNFADGGITNQNPTLLACVNDDTGINSTGSGIGHDITVILDGQVINTTVLNDFYFSGEGNGCVNATLEDFQKGNVSYPFRNLTPGAHQLVFKVWDINNNSTSQTLNFIVKDETDQNLVVKRLLNWPNPFTDKTYIQFEHNCNDALDVNAQIFTITGKLVKTISTQVTAEPFFQGFRTPRTAIEWDGKDDFGDTVAKGVYIFKIFARSQNQDKCRGSATAVEKMVLLK
ncbi:type IX secretion system sortase PorU [Halpernia frigidisoli]|uniref:Peptidase family C25 n=1 Tax=Halpernia frigidisoli TaxID=1125876 RepID=A0A1I3F8I0_9FLAO|nr:type IX secretion system sortase PorU [Halpernia frigidisoli]SFI07508.1 Peptidase family C25 [Halpernia frigidisoli]